MTSSSKPNATKGASRSVTNPNSSGSKGFWAAMAALVLIGALVIGLIVYNGRGAQADRIAENMQKVDGVSLSLADNVITLSGDNADGAKEAGLYEDFSCHYCGELAVNTDDQMLAKIQAGELTVNLHPLIFLDGTGDQYNAGHSTRALAAVLALADKGEIEAYWNLRKALMEQQQNLYATADNDTLADLAHDFGASKGAVEAIRNGEYTDRAKAMGEANAKDLVDKTGDLSSPRVLVDGKDVPSNPLANWIDDLFA